MMSRKSYKYKKRLAIYFERVIINIVITKVFNR